MLQLGILSTAAIAAHHVVPAVSGAGRAEVTAVGSRDLSRAEAFARRLGIPRAHGSYDALLADDGVDAVYIGLPNHLHRDWTRRAAEAGKHVLCEKPLGLDEAEVAEMIAACDQAGVVLMEAFMYRTHPSWVRAIELVRSGRLGELRDVQSTFSYFNDDPDNIRNQVQAGGGALYDIGCYGINSAMLIMDGEPDHVSGMMTVDEATGVDVLTSGLLGFGHRQATFTCATRVESDQRVDIYGSDARLRVEIPFNIPADRPTRLLLAAGGSPPTDPAIEEIVVPPANQYTTQVDGFAEAVLDGAALPVPHADSLATARVIDRLRTEGETRVSP